MTSNIARDDIEELKEDGIDLTVDEIVRLNSFGLKVERGIESSELYTIPRVAMLADVVFHEPTIGSEIWMSKAGMLFNMEDPSTFIAIRALSLSMEQGELPPPDNKEMIVDLSKKLCMKLSNYTVRQVTNAIQYVVEGNNPVDCETLPTPKKKEDEEDELPSDDFCFEIGVMYDGVLLKLGSPTELKKMTASRLLALVQYRKLMKFGFDNKGRENKALGQYYAVLEEIKEKHSKTKEEESNG